MFAQEVLHSDMKAAAVEELEVKICNFIVDQTAALEACGISVPSRGAMLAARAAVATLVAWECGYRHSASEDEADAASAEEKIKELEGELDVAQVGLVEIENLTEKVLKAKPGTIPLRKSLEQVKTIATETLGPSEDEIAK